MQAICEGDSSAVNFRRARKERAVRAIGESRAECKSHPNGRFNERAADTPPFTHRFLLSNSKPETDGD